MKTGAELSSCRRYRYALWRTWDEEKGRILFIGLNPSTADETVDDPTIRRCISYARQWGYGGIVIGNLFAYRSPHPRNLRQCADPVGPQNDRWLRKLRRQADLVVAMWGNGGAYRGRAGEVLPWFPKLMCLRLTGQGQPHHTRGLPDGLIPIPYPGAGCAIAGGKK